jgi:hypothetical protein
MSEHYSKCCCGTHLLHVEKDTEVNQWMVSIWAMGFITDSAGLKHRLRCAYEILKTGKPYGDQVIIDRDKLIALRDYADCQIKISEKK